MENAQFAISLSALQRASVTTSSVESVLVAEGQSASALESTISSVESAPCATELSKNRKF